MNAQDAVQTVEDHLKLHSNKIDRYFYVIRSWTLNNMIMVFEYYIEDTYLNSEGQAEYDEYYLLVAATPTGVKKIKWYDMYYSENCMGSPVYDVRLSRSRKSIMITCSFDDEQWIEQISLKELGL